MGFQFGDETEGSSSIGFEGRHPLHSEVCHEKRQAKQIDKSVS